MEYFGEGSRETIIDRERAKALLSGMVEQLAPLKRVLLLPPDFTRFHSWAGELTTILYELLKDSAHVEILPALGTHAAMTRQEIDRMFPGIPHELFRVHDWRHGLARLGEVPGEFVSQATEGKLDFPITCEVAQLVVEGGWDRIISVGQLVPHEVAGIANYNKNLFVGVGGQDTINKTHFVGAVYGMERMMGRLDGPVRAIFNYMSENFASEIPISYILTVRDRDDRGQMVTRGLFAGDDPQCLVRGTHLCQRVNLDLLDEPLKKTVVYLDPEEYKSTWLGNKAIYRTRMAMADDGELIVMGPGVKEFGEDPEIDRLVRKYGYRGTPHILRMVAENGDLAANLSAAAHLIHGSSEGRFRITWCPGHLSREEIESAGFKYANLADMLDRYPPDTMRDGYNHMPDGEEVFFISNPALGLWGLRFQFEGGRS
ncbi:DUF2088 domain-containing protein [bacterium]|nr:DUF2088 domain-containing protein [bacterium]